jgi:hypothetical protein
MTSFVRLPPLEVHRLADGTFEAELRLEGGISTMEASWWVRKASPQKAVGVGVNGVVGCGENVVSHGEGCTRVSKVFSSGGQEMIC